MSAPQPVDGFLQGVVLPAEGERVVVTYHDDAVISGLWLGGAIWIGLLVAPCVALALERRGRATPPRPRDA